MGALGQGPLGWVTSCWFCSGMPTLSKADHCSKYFPSMSCPRVKEPVKGICSTVAVLKFGGGVPGVVGTMMFWPVLSVTSKVSPATGAGVKKLLAADGGANGHAPGTQAGLTTKLKLSGVCAALNQRPAEAPLLLAGGLFSCVPFTLTVDSSIGTLYANANVLVPRDLPLEVVWSPEMLCWMSKTSQAVGGAGWLPLFDPVVAVHTGFGVPLIGLGDHVVVFVVFGL